MMLEIMIQELVEDDGKVWLLAPKITHNPWARLYELTPEASRSVTNDLAYNWLQAARERHPGAPIVVMAGDELICGFVP